MPNAPHENGHATTRSHRYVLRLRKRKGYPIILATVKRYRGTSIQITTLPKTDLLALASCAIIVRTPYNATIQTPKKKQNVTSPKLDVHHDVQRCL